MYKCPECNKLFDLNDAQEHVIGSCVEKDHPVSVIVACPDCGWKHISGGEPDMYEAEDGIYKPCIMMYGYDYRDVTRRGNETTHGWLVQEGYEQAGKTVELKI